MRVCYFISEADDLPLLSSFIAADFDLTLVLPDDIQPSMLPADAAQLSTCSISDCQEKAFQVALAADWRAALDLFRIPSEQYVLLLERLWHEQFPEDHPEHLVAKSSLRLPVHFLTTSRYVAETLRQLRLDNHCFQISVPNTFSHEDLASDPVAVELSANPVAITRLLAAGKPVITFATPETTELITHAVNGFLVDVEDEDGLERFKQMVHQDADLAQRLVAGAKATAATMPTVNETANQLRTIFEKDFSSKTTYASDWPAKMMATIYQQAVFLHERCETRREELHDAQRSENEAHAEFARFKDTLESDNLYRITQKVRRRF